VQLQDPDPIQLSGPAASPCGIIAGTHGELICTGCMSAARGHVPMSLRYVHNRCAVLSDCSCYTGERRLLNPDDSPTITATAGRCPESRDSPSRPTP
jgi:hypothetical protein